MKTRERFVGEAIRPVAGSQDTSQMASGVPGVPQEFYWRKKRYRVQRVIKTWRDTGPCSHGSSDRYVRKNWFEVVTDTGEAMTLYFERRSVHGAVRRGWRLFSYNEGNKEKAHV